MIGVKKGSKVRLVNDACPSLKNPFNEPFKRVSSKISRRGMVSHSSQDTRASKSVPSKRASAIDSNTSTDKSTGQMLKRKRSCEIVSAEAKLKDFASNAQDEPLPTNPSSKAMYCQTTAQYHLTGCCRNQYVQTPRTFLLHRTIASQTDKEPPLLLIDNETQTEDTVHYLANDFVDTNVEVHNDGEKLRQMYSVVLFKNEKAVEVVPTSWCLSDSLCLQPPPEKHVDVTKWVEECKQAGNDWKKFPIKVLKTGMSYIRAQETLEKAEVAPDLFASKSYIATRLQSKKTRKVALDESDGSGSDTADNFSIAQPKTRLLQSLNASTKDVRLPKPPALRACKNREITSLLYQTTCTCPKELPDFSRSCDNSSTNGFDENIVTNSSKQKPESQFNENSSGTVSKPCDNSSSSGFDENNIMDSSSQTAFKSHISTCISSSVFKDSGSNFELFSSKVLIMLADLNTKMDSLLQSAKQANQEFCVEDDKIQLPINDRDELQALEKVLLEDSVKKNMVLKLTVWGGRNVNDTTRKILNKIFAHNLAVDVNWNGANGKVAFYNLSLRSVIISAVRRNKNLKAVTEYEVEKVIKKWLKYAKDRNGGRLKRDVKNTPANQNDDDE